MHFTQMVKAATSTIGELFRKHHDIPYVSTLLAYNLTRKHKVSCRILKSKHKLSSFAFPCEARAAGYTAQ